MIGVKLGAPPPGEGVVGLLLECHARIRHFAALAVAIAEHEDPEATELVEAAGSVVRYLTEALPLHVADEEESLLPRLRGRDAELDEALQTMHEQHQGHGPVIERVVELCSALAQAPERHGELSLPLVGASVRLRGALWVHLASEEAHVLPAIDRLLSPEEQDAIESEMRGRRDPRA